MDLAEIRKKAKKGRAIATAPVGAESSPPPRASASIQGGPISRGEVAGPPPSLPEAHQPSTAATEDPLEAFFAFRPEIALATEEVYLQTLRAQGEERRETLCEWLTFPLGDEEYALDIEGVSEIIKPREITDIPRVPEFILGVISLRGIIIPVFDLKRRLKMGTGDLTPASRIIVCQQDDRTVGLLVDSIRQVVRIPVSGVEPPPAVLTGLDREFVEGVGRVDGRILIQLDLGNVLNAELV